MLDEDTLARNIIAYLGHEPEVPVRVAYQLSQARARALARAAAPRQAWVRLVQWPSIRSGAGIALVILGFAYAISQFNSSVPDLADLDAGLLTGELPPNAYLDPGFARIVTRVVGDQIQR